MCFLSLEVNELKSLETQDYFGCESHRNQTSNGGAIIIEASYFW